MEIEHEIAALSASHRSSKAFERSTPRSRSTVRREVPIIDLTESNLRQHDADESFQPQMLFEDVAVPDSPETESSHNQTEIVRQNKTLLVLKAAAIAKMFAAPGYEVVPPSPAKAPPWSGQEDPKGSIGLGDQSMSVEPHAAAEMSGEFSRRQEKLASGSVDPEMFGGPEGSRNPGVAKAPPWGGHAGPKV